MVSPIPRMGRTHLAHSAGDAISAVLAAGGYNFRLVLRWLRRLLMRILTPLAPPLRPQTA